MLTQALLLLNAHAAADAGTVSGSAALAGDISLLAIYLGLDSNRGSLPPVTDPDERLQIDSFSRLCP